MGRSMKLVASCVAGAGAMLAAWPLTAQEGEARAQDAAQPTQLEDVVVVATEVEREAEAFVSAVSAAPGEREPAIWRGPICVGVGGMSAEPAQALADRVSDWGHSLGLRIGRPGCTPNIFIVVTSDGDATARDLVARRPGDFTTGASGTDPGPAALRAFQASGRPVRWWHVSLPVNEDTGYPAVRLPGQAPLVFPSSGITRPSDLGSTGMSVPGSRLSRPVRDDLQQVVIVMESDALSQATFGQIADYISMVALAQVDPEATVPVPSILNLFQPDAVHEESLSSWDQAYLRALYDAYLGSASRNANISTLARAMAREKRGATEQPVEAEGRRTP